MDLIGAKDLADFKNLFKTDVKDTFFKAIIIWRRLKTNLDTWKEDNAQGLTEDIELFCLINYNYLRSWPITNPTESGELNAQSIQVLFMKDYLDSLGYAKDGRFNYKPDYDRFIVDGTIRKPMGDSSVSQAGDESLLYEVIMTEQATPTGVDRA